LGNNFFQYHCVSVAGSVARRKHTLQGHALTVTLYQPPKMSRDRIIVRNLPEIKSSQELLLFVENKTDVDVAKIMFADEEGVALVTFENDIGEYFVILHMHQFH
jgi:hypothetical protein